MSASALSTQWQTEQQCATFETDYLWSVERRSFNSPHSMSSDPGWFKNKMPQSSLSVCVSWTRRSKTFGVSSLCLNKLIKSLLNDLPASASNNIGILKPALGNLRKEHITLITTRKQNTFQINICIMHHKQLQNIELISWVINTPLARKSFPFCDVIGECKIISYTF